MISWSETATYPNPITELLMPHVGHEYMAEFDAFYELGMVVYWNYDAQKWSMANNNSIYLRKAIIVQSVSYHSNRFWGVIRFL